MSINQAQAIEQAIRQGLKSLERPAPLTLPEWAEEHFYLSPESSYVEGPWEAMPYQIGIMQIISNDDIRELYIRKATRNGYTKCIVAAIGYFAQHKRRNQVLWQPVDDDAEDFVKEEIDPMLRDVPIVRDIFPDYDKKSKRNTLSKKMFIGSTLDIKGGKAGKNYRRISADVAYFDELDGFDQDIEKEGDPITLGKGRIEGATFPKLICGTTPKIKGTSLIEHCEQNAEIFLRYKIPCPHCGHRQPLEWGGKDADFGFKWIGDDPSTVAYLCIECNALFTQAEYLTVWHLGRWESADGTYMDADGFFRLADGTLALTPLSVALHLWKAYSSMTSWTQIAREFLAAKNDRSKLKTFVNTTLGESWEEDELEKSDPEILHTRREHYRAEVPEGALVLTAGVDTQDDRFEVQVDGWGAGEERWCIDYIRLYGDPSRIDIWNKLAEALRKQYKTESGVMLEIRLVCQDHGGHYGDEVTAFSKKIGVRWVIPVKGASTEGKPVALFPRKRNKKGTYLTEVGTDTAKDLLFQRLQIKSPGPGYWHWPVSNEFDEGYFKQLTAEERKRVYRSGRATYLWVDGGRRNEAWDCSVYSLAAIRILQQHMGINLERLSGKVSTPKSHARGRHVRGSAHGRPN